jgi:tRNA A-37 threonylcarbamoyl transferase component Bud32
MISAERWKLIEPLVDAALELPPEERTEYLRIACAGDVSLHDEVAAFIAHSESTNPQLRKLLSEQADVARTIANTTPTVPTVLAERYRLDRVLGQGGMATVYLAEDLRLQRKVAVKLLRQEQARNRGRERFAAEVRLTANLRHPNIVPLFDSGEADGWSYFVMPYINGVTVHDHLTRLGRVPTGDAVRIVRDVLAALEHAHNGGVIHRDVKPSNVMLADGHAMLADFGIAVDPQSDELSLTAQGAVVGTPSYMSPEQLVADAILTPATDIYSAGCLLYELVTGRPPLRAQARKALDDNGSDAWMQDRDALLPVAPELEMVLAQALSVQPSDRFASAAAMSDALAAEVRTGSQERTGGSGAHPGVERRRAVTPAATATPRRWLIALACVTALAGGVIAVRARSGGAGLPFGAASGATTGDSARVLLLPLTGDSASVALLGEPDAVRAGLARWRGVTLVDRTETADAMAQLSDARLTTASTRALAQSLHAGRFITRDVARRGSQLLLHAMLHDGATGRVIAEHAVTLPSDLAALDSVAATLADALLLSDVPAALRRGSFTRGAVQWFARGMHAIDEWDLPAADTAFARAAVIDPAFARSELWLAQVRVWQRAPRESWNFLLTRTAGTGLGLDARERTIRDAMRAEADDDRARACGIWERLAATDSADFPAWYGAGKCLLADNAVVRDVRSPSGFRFRTSYQHGLDVLLRAYRTLPAVHREFRAGWFQTLSYTLLADASALRSGFAIAPDTGLFAAARGWNIRGDTLALIPYRASDFAQNAAWALPPTHALALRRQRELQRAISATWRSAFPQSADALLALSLSLDALNDDSAIDSIRVARRLASTRDEYWRSSMAMVWMLVKRGLPADAAQLREARIIGDSLLREFRGVSGDEANAMASIAALLGREHLAATFVRQSDGAGDIGATIPLSLKRAAAVLDVYAASGRSSDSLAVIERRVMDGIRQSVPPEGQPGTRFRLLGRSATLAMREGKGPGMLPDLAAAGEPLATAQVAWQRGDSAEVRRSLAVLAAARRTLSPEETTLEAVVPEAELLLWLGDRNAARQRIGPTLAALAASDIATLETPVGAGLLLRALELFASLEREKSPGNRASQWLVALRELTGNASLPSSARMAPELPVSGSAVR